MVTYNNGDYTDGGVKRTCLLEEGAVTVSTAYGIGGGSAATYAFAAEITKGMVVTVSTDTGNTWAATAGSVLVSRIANAADLVMGVVISEPEWTKKPATTAAADSLAKRLTGKFLRAATVWFPNVTAMTKANLLTADASATVPGTLSTLILDVSVCNASGGITVNDIATAGGSANMCSMHYVGKVAAGTTTPIMIAFLGGKTIAQT